MISKSTIKLLRSLSVKKYRLKEKLFLIEGTRLFSEALKSNYPIKHIWVLEETIENSSIQKLLTEFRTSKTPIDIVSQIEIKQISETIQSQGIVGIAQIPEISTHKDWNQNLLILDRISDPGNLGTLLRTAEWFGIKTVILSENCADLFNPKVVRSAMGAHFYQRIFQTNLFDLCDDLLKSNYSIIGGLMDGESLESLDISDNNWALILGSEAHGIDENLVSKCTHKVTIPKFGNLESLNVTSAGGILLHELKNR
ncbi:MAG: RNA methyltransferase [Candidatus Marinimicrobia bacterium]|nr:RNA methyltransferase [Candidatus Neomarinimicrobiota bacterium]MBL7023160.1 RNA methyltransferase [Candidatus Neomarinimicrobiota bacterium]MBL7109032.1 RNA methyltransferase [Candidatus Neomarinimicrobiota bacterium]